MPVRPILTAPAFGEWLATQRGDRSYEAIAQRLRPLVKEFGLKVDRSSIKKFEAGRVPNWPMLWALSVVYETALPQLVKLLIGTLLVLRADKTLQPLVRSRPPFALAPSVPKRRIAPERVRQAKRG